MSESKCPVVCAICEKRACPYESVLMSHSSAPKVPIYVHEACSRDDSGRAKLVAKFARPLRGEP